MSLATMLEYPDPGISGTTKTHVRTIIPDCMYGLKHIEKLLQIDNIHNKQALHECRYGGQSKEKYRDMIRKIRECADTIDRIVNAEED